MSGLEKLGTIVSIGGVAAVLFFALVGILMLCNSPATLSEVAGGTCWVEFNSKGEPQWVRTK